MEGEQDANAYSPFFFKDKIFDWLNSALDIGIEENIFWDMSLAELERKFESYKRVKENQQKEKATFDYILADLIGISIGRLYNKNNKYPKIADAYPTLFTGDAETEQKKKDIENINRFKAFANSFNKKWEGAKECRKN